MMRRLSNIVACLALTAFLAGFCSHVASQQDEPKSPNERVPTVITTPATCPITQPPSIEFVPPAPYPTKISSNGFWLGSEKLWTSRSKDGLWRGYWTTEHGVKRKVYFDKVFWWRKGYDWRTENPPQLKVSGRRLDAPASPFYLNQAHPAFMRNPAMLTGIDIPSVGCWEITGDYKSDKLTFVVWVVDPPANIN